MTLTTDAMAVILNTSAPRTELSDERFLEKGVSIVDDLTLLASFAARARLLWFGYSLRSLDFYEYSRRAGIAVSNGRFSNDELPFSAPKLYQFYATSYEGIRRLRAGNLDISSAIHFFIDGCNKSRLLEEQFAMLFLALEHLNDMLSDGLGIVRIIDSERFTQLKREWASWLKGQALDASSMASISQKLPELNRYPLKHCLQTIFSTYGVEYLDLYPRGTREMEFVNIRNRLFHTASAIEPAQLAKETMRLRIVVQRLIMRLLGWDDLHLCPPPIEKEWLVSTKQ